MVTRSIILYACVSKSAYFLKFQRLSTASTCKVRYTTRYGIEESCFSFITGLGFASNLPIYKEILSNLQQKKSCLPLVYYYPTLS